MYLNKKAVLEFIKSRKAKFAGSYKDIDYGAYMELEKIEAYIESGAFYADATYDEWRQLAADSIAEIQRLRALLERLDSYIDFSEHLSPGDWGIEDVTGINSLFDEVREALDAAKVKRFECPSCGCEISINAPKGDGNDCPGGRCEF